MSSRSLIERHSQDERLCLFCKHFKMLGEPGFSELTPGSPIAIQCLKNKWEFSPGDHEDDFRTAMLHAQTCKKFLDWRETTKEEERAEREFKGFQEQGLKKKVNKRLRKAMAGKDFVEGWTKVIKEL